MKLVFVYIALYQLWLRSVLQVKLVWCGMEIQDKVIEQINQKR